MTHTGTSTRTCLVRFGPTFRMDLCFKEMSDQRGHSEMLKASLDETSCCASIHPPSPRCSVTALLKSDSSNCSASSFEVVVCAEERSAVRASLPPPGASGESSLLWTPGWTAACSTRAETRQRSSPTTQPSLCRSRAAVVLPRVIPAIPACLAAVGSPTAAAGGGRFWVLWGSRRQRQIPSESVSQRVV